MNMLATVFTNHCRLMNMHVCIALSCTCTHLYQLASDGVDGDFIHCSPHLANSVEYVVNKNAVEGVPCIRDTTIICLT